MSIQQENPGDWTGMKFKSPRPILGWVVTPFALTITQKVPNRQWSLSGDSHIQEQIDLLKCVDQEEVREVASEILQSIF